MKKPSFWAVLALAALAAGFSGCQGEETPPPPELVKPEPRAPFDEKELGALRYRAGQPDVETIEDANGKLLAISGRLQAKNDTSAATSQEAAIRFLLGFGAKNWGWGSQDEHLAIVTPAFESIAAEKTVDTGKLRIRPVQVMQLLKGIPMEDRLATVQVSEHSKEKGFILTGYQGRLGPEPVGVASATPVLSLDRALFKASSDPRITSTHPNFPYGPNHEWTYRGKLVWSEATGALKLAYRVLGLKGDHVVRLSLLIDANTGDLLQVDEEEITDLHESTTVYWGTASAWAAPATRIDVPMLQESDGRYAMASHFGGGPGVVYLSDTKNSKGPADIIFRDTINFTDTGYLPHRYATDAYFHALTTIDFFNKSFGWLSWNGIGGDLRLNANYNPDPSKPAGFNASARGGNINLFAGLPGWGDKPAAAALSVVGHEFGHLVIESTSPLQYKNQSGALNEAIADLLGQLVRDWSSDILGNECSADGTRGVRNMANPPARGQPDRLSNYVVTEDDAGGVHTNSGIVNKAHYLMVKGGEFNGLKVQPIATSLPDSLKAIGKLTMSAFQSGLFYDNTTLQEYAAGIYGWCRSNRKLFSTKPDDVCGSLHDALTAVELLSFGAGAPTDLMPVLKYAAVDSGSYGPYTRIGFTIRNLGAAKFKGTVTAEFRSSGGTIAYGKTSIFLELDGRSETSATHIIYGFTRELIDQLPTEGVLTLIVDPAIEANPYNNKIKVALSAEPVPIGTRDSVIKDGKLQLKLKNNGKFPLVSGDVAARILFRADGTSKFTYAPGVTDAPKQKLNAESLLPDTFNGPAESVLNLEETAPAGMVALPPPMPGGNILTQIGGINFGYVRLGKDGQLRNSMGTVISGPTVFAVLNSDRRFPVGLGSNVLFCLNCQASDGVSVVSFSVVDFETEAPVGALFPAEIASMLQDAVPIKLKPVPVVMLPNFFSWVFTPGVNGGIGGPWTDPDPMPVLRARSIKNAGF